MQISHVAAVLIWAISLASIFCMLVRPRGIAEAYWMCAGAAILVVTRLIPLGQASHAVYEGLDVYLFLAGMMILAELAREEHVFDWMAGFAARHAKNSGERLFALIYGVGVIVTALLSNDATAVVLTPAVLAVARRAKVDPKPHLLACAFIANAASFVLPISNPANLVVFQRNIPALTKWLGIFWLPSCISVLLTFLCLRWVSRKSLAVRIHNAGEAGTLSTEGKLALAGLIVAGITLIALSAFGLPLGAATCCAAFFALAIVTVRDRSISWRVAKGASWSVLPLVAGLFVIVEALQSAGLLRAGLAGLQMLGQQSIWIGKLLAAFAVAFLSNGMNNLPVGLMSGAAIQHARETGVMAHAILIGVDLGPNLSVTGSLATILWLIALRREKIEIRAWEFLKVGAIAMPIALIGSVLVLSK